MNNCPTGKDYVGKGSFVLPFRALNSAEIKSNEVKNFGCSFLALGGITIEEGAFIAPHCVLATEHHPENPATRHSLLSKPIIIGRNAWIGANATTLARVTIGENAIVAGMPAKVIRMIKQDNK